MTNSFSSVRMDSMPPKEQIEPIANYLGKKLSGYGMQTEMGKATGISKAIISQWVRGQVIPNFASCLKIADYFKEDPVTIFGMCGRPEMIEEYQRLMSQKNHPKDPANSVNAKHRECHRKLQTILESGREAEELVIWNIEAIYDRVVRGTIHGKLQPQKKPH